MIKTRKDLPQYLNNHNLLGYGVEIGVLKGEFSTHILRNWKGLKLYLIDSWRYIQGNIDLNNTCKDDQGENLAQTFRAIYEFGDRAVLIRDFSVNASTLFNDKYFDFIFIDANHTHAAVIADLESWWPKLKPNGIMMGHDYTDGLWNYSGNMVSFGVKSAVDSFVKKNNLVLNLTDIDDSFFPSWYFHGIASCT